MLNPAPHILIMDDAQEILDLLREFLEEEGYRVTTSLAILDVSQIVTLAPDIILVEWRFRNCPDAGWRLVHRVRLEPALAGTAVVLCTTEQRPITDIQVAQALQYLRVAVVRKPCVLDQLIRAVQRALRAPHLRVVVDAGRLSQGNPDAAPAAGSPRWPQPVQLFSLSQGGE